MIERQPTGEDAAIMEYLPLARAAALAHDRLFPDQTTKDAKTLDVIALALSTLISIYEREESGALRLVTESELGAGRFTRGAMRLEMWGAHRKSGLLAKVAGLPVEIVAPDGTALSSESLGGEELE